MFIKRKIAFGGDEATMMNGPSYELIMKFNFFLMNKAHM